MTWVAYKDGIEVYFKSAVFIFYGNVTEEVLLFPYRDTWGLT